MYRIRVKDINDAFQELGRMITQHRRDSDKSLTKLNILQTAVQVIQDLEAKVKGELGLSQLREGVGRTESLNVLHLLLLLWLVGSL